MNYDTNLFTLSEISPKDDAIFKRLFGGKGNEGILKDFLEALLDIKIDNLELDLSTELQAEFNDGKKSIVDVRARLINGTEINIEMQNSADDFSEQRCLQYWSKIYSNTLKKSKNYKELKKTICIWFLNENVYSDLKKFESKWTMKNELETTSEKHFDFIEFHIIELQKFVA